jgi:ABC-type sugar transport system ATPase subunit
VAEARTRTDVALSLRGVGRTYGATVALDGVDLEVARGTVHALVGENGAGKSTLLGVLAGRVAPTAGTVQLFGAPLATGEPRAARQAGIVAIYQELTTIAPLSAAANVFLGDPATRAGFVARRATRRRFAELAARVGSTTPPDARAGDQSVAAQQLLEVMRALHAEAPVILLDEPTAPLAAPERRALLDLMRSLRADGVTMLFVSHNLDEVLAIADHVSVFRDGRLVRTAPAPTWRRASLVAAMLGDRAAELGAAARPAPTAVRDHGDDRVAGPPALAVRGLRLPGVLHHVALTARRGEIVGIGGLVGSGRTSVLRALAGLERSADGTLELEGRPVAWPRTVRDALANGLALVPEDRKGQGLVLGLSGTRNVTLADQGRTARRGWVRPGRARAQAAAAATPYGFDADRLGAHVRALSGGNQQKLLLARWAHRPPRVLLADEPTRGIDVGAKAQILATLRGFAAQGCAVVIVSSEQEELLTTADRIVVLAGGRVAAELDNRRRAVTETDILTAAFSQEDHRAVA